MYKTHRGFKVNVDNFDRYTGFNITKKIIDNYYSYLCKKFKKTRIIYYYSSGMNHNIRQNNDVIINLIYDDNGVIRAGMDD